MKRLAIITARGGSKRIPRKNIKDFCGKPIIAYSIEAVKEAGMFDEIMVSTDDEEIAEVARSHGAKVPFYRSEATSNDFATTNDVLLEVIAEYEKRGLVLSYRTAAVFIRNLLDYDCITEREARIMLGALTDNALPFPAEIRDRARARIFKNMITTLIGR